MARTPASAYYFMFFLVVVAVLSMHVLAYRNGTAAYGASFNIPGAYLPNTSIPIQAWKTGTERFDRYVAIMLSVFWVDLDPRNVVPHIQGTHFLGTLSGAWMLMLVEAHRVDAPSWFLARTYIVETLGELAGLGFATPIWCCIQLSSMSVDKPRKMAYADSVSLPIAVVLGHFLPTAMMITCAPDGQGVLSQQTWVLARLLHPVFTYGIWRVLRIFSTSDKPSVSPRAWYTMAMVIAVIFHIIALAPLLMVYLADGWLQAEVVQQFDFWKIFVPAPFWTPQPAQVTTFIEGASHFLQWDELLTALAITAWARRQYMASRAPKDSASIWAYMGLLVVIGGPVAAAAYMMQETDRVETERAISEQRKEAGSSAKAST